MKLIPEKTQCKKARPGARDSIKTPLPQLQRSYLPPRYKGLSWIHPHELSDVPLPASCRSYFIFLHMLHSDSPTESPRAENVAIPPEVTDAEKKALEVLKNLLVDTIAQYPGSNTMPEVFGDVRLLMFLRVAKNDPQKAANQFKEFLVWRRERNVDKIREDILEKNMSFDEVPNIKRASYYLPFNPCLRDPAGEPLRAKDGSFIYCERLGMIETNGFIGEVSDDEFSEMFIYLSELGQLLIHDHHKREPHDNRLQNCGTARQGRENWPPSCWLSTLVERPRLPGPTRSFARLL
ncbi:Transfer protein [Perkinsus olseni]|uniref:Transfer protein n=1 Tax=Perkinsus olseni TaxID=32597 RepID=A0A7J6R7K2_PEROL|nr:Transfer protein [Perkinsus olseni]